MEEDNKSPKEESKQEEAKSSAAGGGGWGGWGFSPLSVLSDLQKAAEEISRNAVEVAGKAAQTLAADIQNVGDEESESSAKEEEEDGGGVSDKEGDKEEDGEDEKRRKSAMEKLEKASQDSVLGQGLKVLDHSVENLASGAWQALGNAWRGGSDFVQKLEQSIQHGAVPGGSGPQSILESGKAFTAKGMQVLEYVGKELDSLIAEPGTELEKKSKSSHQEADDDQLLEEVTFDRCFYIYGGPEQLEELEALSNHHALIFNRKKGKLSPEQKSAYDGKLKQVQQVFDLSNEINGDDSESSKGKKIETMNDENSSEFKTLHESSVSKAANMATSFTGALAGLSSTDMIQKTAGRLESLHSEGVHRLSEMCCSAVSHLQMLGKSIISNASNKVEEDADGNTVKIDWPEDPIEKAKVIRANAQSMTGYVEAVSNSFITGISDVAEAYTAAIKSAIADSEKLPQTSILEKAKTFSELLQSDQTIALAKIQDGIQYLANVVISTSMPPA